MCACEARDVLRAQVLRVLDAEASVARAVVAFDLFIDGQNFVVRRVADGVNHHL